MSLVAGAILASIGWSAKLLVDRRRHRAVLAEERRKDLTAYVRQTSDNRKRGYDKFLAAANAYQFVRATEQIADNVDALDFSHLVARAHALSEDAAREIRSNMRDTEPFDKVCDYFIWLFQSNHPLENNPGVEEFDRLLSLQILCERVVQEHEASTVLDVPRSVGEENEFKKLSEAATQRVVLADGTSILGFADDQAIPDWIAGIPVNRDKWLESRSICWVQMKRSGLFDDDLPPRPE